MRQRSRGLHAVVRAASLAAARGHLQVGTRLLPCALGRSGRRAIKREGDGATPVGSWPARMVLYRPDAMPRPRTGLPCRPIRRTDGWCDAPHDRNYNRLVPLPYPASTEEMWRADALYDVVVVLGYNDHPRRRGAGSAIFMHVARPGFEPTAGCVALRRAELVRLVGRMRPGSRVVVPAR